MADLNGDGVLDAVVGTGPGTVTQVRVLDGKTGTELFSIQPFEAAFTGGVYVSTGDLTGSGKPDLIITPDQGGGPRVRIFDGGNNFAQINDFFGIDDPNFRGGARAAVGDFNHDGRDLAVAAAGGKFAYNYASTLAGLSSNWNPSGDKGDAAFELDFATSPSPPRRPSCSSVWVPAAWRCGETSAPGDGVTASASSTCPRRPRPGAAIQIPKKRTGGRAPDPRDVLGDEYAHPPPDRDILPRSGGRVNRLSIVKLC
jgi:hypothetical protein